MVQTYRPPAKAPMTSAPLTVEKRNEKSPYGDDRTRRFVRLLYIRDSSYHGRIKLSRY